VERNPAVTSGEAVIKGTRVSVPTIARSFIEMGQVRQGPGTRLSAVA
jgi:uncharacterized protein (DUF433 family)